MRSGDERLLVNQSLDGELMLQIVYFFCKQTNILFLLLKVNTNHGNNILLLFAIRLLSSICVYFFANGLPSRMVLQLQWYTFSN